jgi:ribose transport system permease protein
VGKEAIGGRERLEETVRSARRIPRPAWLGRLRDLGIPLAVLIVFAYLTFASPVFLTERNLLNVLDQSAIVGMIAAAGTLVLIAGCLDLSTGAVFAISGVIAAMLVHPIGAPAAIAVGSLSGIVFGLVNGVISTAGRVNSIITTLATGIVVRGLALVITGGALVRVTTPDFAFLGGATVGGATTAVFVFIAVVAVTWFLLARTVFGRYIFAVGGNLEAAQLSGVQVGRVRIVTFVISGLAAAMAGVLSASRVSTGQADAGIGLEINAIAAILIGGTSIAGGDGAVWRTAVGVLLVTLIGNGFNLLNVNPIWQQVFQGAVILGAVALDSWSRGRRS